MQALWDRKAASIREIQEAFPEENMPSYTTVQTTVLPAGGKECCTPGEKDKQPAHL
jgi:predicted transcriptional regulator